MWNSKFKIKNSKLRINSVILLSWPKRPILCISAPLYPFSPQTRLGVTSRSGALHPKKAIYYTSIKLREHKHCCQLVFETRLTGFASLPGVLTQPFYLLSKPNSPVAYTKTRATSGTALVIALRRVLRSPHKLKFAGAPFGHLPFTIGSFVAKKRAKVLLFFDIRKKNEFFFAYIIFFFVILHDFS